MLLVYRINREPSTRAINRHIKLLSSDIPLKCLAVIQSADDRKTSLDARLFVPDPNCGSLQSENKKAQLTQGLRAKAVRV